MFNHVNMSSLYDYLIMREVPNRQVRLTQVTPTRADINSGSRHCVPRLAAVAPSAFPRSHAPFCARSHSPGYDRPPGCRLHSFHTIQQLRLNVFLKATHCLDLCGVTWTHFDFFCKKTPGVLPLLLNGVSPSQVNPLTFHQVSLNSLLVSRPIYTPE